jgi:hypothetical protein
MGFTSPIKASVMNTLTMGCFESSVMRSASTSNTYCQFQASYLPAGGIFLDLEQRNEMAQNAG